MRSIVRDRVAWSVCRSVTIVSPAKTAEPIEMAFELRTWLGPTDHVLDESSDPTWEGAIFFWEGGRMGVPLYSIGTFYGRLWKDG